MEYFWIGHCKEGTSDKIWGIIKLNDTTFGDSDYVSFWGRRGRKLQTKLHKDAGNYEMEQLLWKKQDRGYNQIDTTKLSDVYPEFEQDLEQTAVWAMLSA